MIRNFLFHRVNPVRDQLWDPMDPELFKRCIKYISNKYQVVLLENLLELDDLYTSKNKYATILFDDGYHDNIEFAIPILKKFSVPASFYVVTNCIDNNIPTWTHIFEHLFQNTKKNKLILNFDFIPDNYRNILFYSKNDKIKLAGKLKPFIKTLKSDQRELVLDNIKQTFNDVDLPKIMMNWDEIKQLSEDGYYIGSHTVSHKPLGTISDQGEIKKELLNSGQRIKEKLGYFPKTISYPIGSYNEMTIKIAKEVGYQIGLAVKQDIYNPKKDNIFEVPRIELYNERWFKTKLRISNQLEELKKIIHYR